METQIHTLKGGGQPLPNSVRTFFEPRFGHDFSQVRVHTDARAAASAQAVHSRAYTAGNDVVFGPGQFRPHTMSGRRLLAHELTHVVQQSVRAPATQTGLPNQVIAHFPSEVLQVQCMSIGRRNPPNWAPPLQLGVVPQDERRRVNAAINQIREVVNNSRRYADCHSFFERRCPGGNANSMQTTFNNAILWKLTRPSGDELARGDISGRNIAYSQSGYSQGANGLAQTLVHEMMHNCGITGGDEHHLADVAGLYCIGSRNIVTISGGVTLGGDRTGGTELVTYRRILTGWAGGQLQLTTGGDVNVIGLGAETITAIRQTERPSGEFASAMVGLRGRTNLLWGGERFGGLVGTVDTGVGVGRFRLRDPEVAGRSRTAVAGDLILQVGVGAEFYLPIGVNAMPMSVEAAYRLAQPLNPEAERIHSFLLGVGFHY